MKETPDQRRARMTANTRAYRARHPERVRQTRQKVYGDRKRRAMEMIGGALGKTATLNAGGPEAGDAS